MKVNNSNAKGSKGRRTYGGSKGIVKKNSIGNRSTIDDTEPGIFNESEDDIAAKQYTNGSYIFDKFSLDTLFIAMQAPLEKNFDKFWQMLWNEDIRHVYCLTKLHENGKVQAEQYWPNTSKVTNHFEVKCLSKLPKSFFAKRVIEIKNRSTGETKTIVHYQITEWCDNKIPEGQMMNQFRKLVLNCVKELEKRPVPILVHCR